MPVQHYKQSHEGACLPACARMVLAAQGDERTEQQIAEVLDSYEFGTPASHAQRLSKLGYQVEYGPTSIEELESAIQRGMFPIVFVRADFLPWADFSGFHALVLTEVTTRDVSLLDPALDAGPITLSREGFLLAWEEFDSLAAIISRG